MPEDTTLMHARRCVEDALSATGDTLRTIQQSRNILEASRELLQTIRVPRSPAEVFVSVRGGKLAGM